MDIEGLLATMLVVGLMAGAVIVLGRSWPRSSRLGGYRARLRGSRDDGSGATGDAGVREDDDLQWRWRDEAGPGPDERGDGPP